MLAASHPHGVASNTYDLMLPVGPVSGKGLGEVWIRVVEGREAIHAGLAACRICCYGWRRRGSRAEIAASLQGLLSSKLSKERQARYCNR